MNHTKKMIGILLAIFIVLNCFALFANAAPPSGWTTTKPSGSYVMVYATTTAAIKSGPLYGSQWYYQVSATANTNNQNYVIPAVSTLFELNSGWEIDYVYVTGNSSGQRQPGNSILLASSGATLVYYFKKSTPVTYSLTVNTIVNGSIVNSTPKGSFESASVVSIAPNTSSFDTANYTYTFTGWSLQSGIGSFAGSSNQTTNFTTGSANTVVTASFTSQPKPPITYSVSIQTFVDNQLLNTTGKSDLTQNSQIPILPDQTDFDFDNYDYSFQGWSLLSGSGTFSNPNASETSFTVNGNAVLKALFTRTLKVKNYPISIKYVDYENQSDIVAATSTVLTGKAGDQTSILAALYWNPILISNEIISQYELYPDNQSQTATLGMTSNITFTVARIKTYTIHYELNGGNPGENLFVDTGSPYRAGTSVTILNGIPTKDGFEFTGWRESNHIYQPGQTFDMPENNVILKAVWEPVTLVTEEPTDEPTAEASATPTTMPTEEVTEAPTATLTMMPTEELTEEPTATPTEEVTKEPAATPTATSTEEATAEPTNKPTEELTAELTATPTVMSDEEITEEPAIASTITPAIRVTPITTATAVPDKKPEPITGDEKSNVILLMIITLFSITVISVVFKIKRPDTGKK